MTDLSTDGSDPHGENLRAHDSSEEDFVHERVELPEWIPVAFGLILVAIAALAIWAV